MSYSAGICHTGSTRRHSHFGVKADINMFSICDGDGVVKCLQPQAPESEIAVLWLSLRYV